VAIQVGKPKWRGTADASDPLETPWRSAIFKESVEGAVWLGRTNLAGDAQADLRVHGGPEKAVLGYSAEHYPDWQRELALDLPYGAFGENFTISGQDESSVCVGDSYAVGEGVVQVAQPRQPCSNLARRWHLAELPAQVMKSQRGGWYFRVLQEGNVAAGQEVRLLERPCPDLTIARVFALRREGTDRETAAKLSACELLSRGWRKAFAEMAEK
jgi:MOSC domain-containing protein YiiM